MVASSSALAVEQQQAFGSELLGSDLQQPSAEFETSCHLGDELVLCFRVLRENLQHLALQFRIAGDSRKKPAPDFRILLKLPKDVSYRGRTLEWNNREMLQQPDGLCQQIRAILRLPSGSNRQFKLVLRAA